MFMTLRLPFDLSSDSVKSAVRPFRLISSATNRSAGCLAAETESNGRMRRCDATTDAPAFTRMQLERVRLASQEILGAAFVPAELMFVDVLEERTMNETCRRARRSLTRREQTTNKYRNLDEQFCALLIDDLLANENGRVVDRATAPKPNESVHFGIGTDATLDFYSVVERIPLVLLVRYEQTGRI
jgi:hypothetical protein